MNNQYYQIIEYNNTDKEPQVRILTNSKETANELAATLIKGGGSKFFQITTT
jgi:hypothetical protein